MDDTGQRLENLRASEARETEEGDEDHTDEGDEETGVKESVRIWEIEEEMTTIAGTMSGMPVNTIPQIADSIKLRRSILTHFSLILNQVENGVAVRMAVLYLLAGGE